MMYSKYFEAKRGYADKHAVRTLSREVSRIVTEQVKKSISNIETNKKETHK